MRRSAESSSAVCGRITGAPGVCFGTFGSGATNLATGVGGALLAAVAVLAAALLALVLR